MRYYVSLPQRFLHVNHMLVCASSPVQPGITQFFFIASVHQHIDIVQNLVSCQCRPFISGVQPDCFVRKPIPDFFCEFGNFHFIYFVERIAATEGDTGNIWFLQLVEKFMFFFFCKWKSAVRIPSHWILALRAAVAAPCYPQHHAKPITV